MKLLYLSRTNLTDRLFVQDFVHNFKFEDKALLLHQPAETVPDTQFATKRLSALLSENMVYNHVFSAHLRNFFYKSGGQMQVNSGLIQQLLEPVQLLLLSPVIHIDGRIQLADPVEMMIAARKALDVDEAFVFTGNPLSPLAAKKALINDREDFDKWVKIYEEERGSLELAHTLRPAVLASPVNYAR
jgi:hypothetical protein